MIFKHFWKIKDPKKVLAFTWKVLQDKIPTKMNLFKRMVMRDPQELACGFCNQEMESGNNLFIHCDRAYKTWMKVYDWLGFEVVLPYSTEELYMQHMGLFGGMKRKKRGMVVWHSLIWSIWLDRNALIFKNEQFKMGRLIESIK